MQHWPLLTCLLVGWGNFGGSEAGGVEGLPAGTASSAGDDTNLGSKTHKLPFFLTDGYLPSPPAPRPWRAQELPQASFPSQGGGAGEQTCFEQKGIKAKPQMNPYHFKGEKKDNDISHHPANELQPPQPVEAMRRLPSSSPSSFPSSCPRSCLFMIWLMTKLIKVITQLSS